MKSSNFRLIIFILIALLYIEFQKIDCKRYGESRSYRNFYPASVPMNDSNNGQQNSVEKNLTELSTELMPIRYKRSNRRKISGSGDAKSFSRKISKEELKYNF